MVNKVKNLLAGGTIQRDALQIYAIQFLSLGLGLVGSIIVARTLGPANKGIFDLFNLLSSFIVEFGLLGFGSGLLYYLANKGEPVSKTHGTGLIFVLVMGCLTAITGWFGLPCWKRIFPGLQDWIILLAFFGAPAAYYRIIWSNILTGINRAVVTYRIGLYITVVNILAIVTLWASNRLDVENIIRLTAMLGVINGIVAFIILCKHERKVKASLSLARNSLRYGLVIYVGFIANIMHFKIDQVMINYWLGTKAVGIYAVSVRWAEMLFF